MRLSGSLPCVTLALYIGSFPAQGAQADCEPWPGEPRPLATASSSDPLTARYASLRAGELSALAHELEPVAPADAYRVWLHVACLDPEREDARAGVDRTSPLRIHAPEVVREPEVPTTPAPDVASALKQLDDPILVASASGAAKAAAKPLARVPGKAALAPQPVRTQPRAAPVERPLVADGLLDEAEGLVRDAHFEEALDKATKAQEDLPRTGDEAALRKRRVRADVIAGTAQVALGKDADARASFERALQIDPSLRLDRATTSPKVVRAFDAARAAATGGAP